MDFDDPKVYGDTFISDGLVFIEKKNFVANDNLATWGRRKTEAVPWKLSVHGEKILS